MDTKGVSGVVGTEMGAGLRLGGRGLSPGLALLDLSREQLPFPAGFRPSPADGGHLPTAGGKEAGAVPRGLSMDCSYTGLRSSVSPKPPAPSLLALEPLEEE